METPLHLDRAIKSVWTVSAFIVLCLIMLAFFPFYIIPSTMCLAGTVAGIVIVIGMFVVRLYIEAYYDSYIFILKHDAVYVEKGVIFKLKVMIPYSRIQNVDVYRGPLLRGFGLGNIQLFTAGTGMMESQITGITEALIPALSDKILSFARASRGTGVVGTHDEAAPAAAAMDGARLERLVSLQEESLLELKRIRKLLEEGDSR